MDNIGEFKSLVEHRLTGAESSTKSAHRRIDEINDTVKEIYSTLNGIHKLTASVEMLTLQVKTLAENMSTSNERMETRIEEGFKSQGERIGAIEKEPAQKWKAFVKHVFQLAVAAVVGAVILKITGK
ncbi:MAG: hypothetical protein LBS19_06145 [Clostridiales bacterium]|jgi:uncharacterized protein YoxC|nr:hypothetical protein [Clostridiales bacterium]